MELLVTDDSIRELILAGATSTELHRAAVSRGMTSVFEDGLRRVRGGQTSLEEVLAVCDIPQPQR